MPNITLTKISQGTRSTRMAAHQIRSHFPQDYHLLSAATTQLRWAFLSTPEKKHIYIKTIFSFLNPPKLTNEVTGPTSPETIRIIPDPSHWPIVC